MVTKTALMLLAPGNEEIEFVVPVDILRRAGVSNALKSLPHRTGRNCIFQYIVLIGESDCGWLERWSNRWRARFGLYARQKSSRYCNGKFALNIHKL